LGKSTLMVIKTTAVKPIAKLAFLTRYAIYVLLYFASKVTLQSEISILMYHSIGTTCSRYSVSIAEFRRQIDYLVRNCRVVSLGEIVDFLEGRRRLPRRSVAITFDDGYFDNYQCAYPYLKKHHLPATIFISTAYLQKKKLSNNCKLSMLDWDEIAEMIQNNIDFGAHTARHPDLCEIDIDSAKREILKSKTEIEKMTGKKVNYFAYPYGRYNRDVVNLVGLLGFRGAFGGEGVIHKDANTLVIHRVEVKRSIGYAMFKMRLTAALDWYKKFEQALKVAFEDFPPMSLVVDVYNSLDSQN